MKSAVKKNTFKKIQQITLPVQQIDKEIEYFFLFSESIQSKPDNSKRAQVPRVDANGEIIGDQKMVNTVIVTNLETLDDGIIVLPQVLNSELQKINYVGRAFSIVKHEVKGKDYSLFDIAEVELPEDFFQQYYDHTGLKHRLSPSS